MTRVRRKISRLRGNLTACSQVSYHTTRSHARCLTPEETLAHVTPPPAPRQIRLLPAPGVLAAARRYSIARSPSVLEARHVLSRRHRHKRSTSWTGSTSRSSSRARYSEQRLERGPPCFSPRKAARAPGTTWHAGDDTWPPGPETHGRTYDTSCITPPAEGDESSIAPFTIGARDARSTAKCSSRTNGAPLVVPRPAVYSEGR
jgi:hypothetical protein